MLQSDWTAHKCCNLIGLQNSCSGTNPGIAMSPNLTLFRVEVGLYPTKRVIWKESCYNNGYSMNTLREWLYLTTVS